MLTVRLNSKGQITIPRTIRKQLSLNTGDEIGLRSEGNNIIIFPKQKKQSNIESAFGLLQAKVSVSTEDMEKAIRQRAGHDCD